MASLNIGGQKVTVDDSFLSMSPEQQNATVEEIAGSLGSQGAQPQQAQPQAPTGPTIKAGGREISIAEYGALSPEERQQLQQTIAQSGTHSDTLDNKGSALDTAVQGITFGFGDEIRAGAQGGISALQGGDFGSSFDQSLEQSRGNLADFRRREPVAAVASEIGGALLPAIATGGGALLAKGASLGARALAGAGAGLTQGALYGAGAADGDINDRVRGAAVGGSTGAALGGVAPFVGNAAGKAVQRFKQGQVLNAAAKSASNSTATKTAAASLFDQSKNANIGLNKDAVSRMWNKIQSATSKMKPNEILDPEAVGVLKVFQQTFDDVTRQGSNVVPDLQDLHILRQAAQQAAGSSKSRTSKIGSDIIKSLDDFITTLKPGDVAGGADPKSAASALLEGISTWGRASKMQTIEKAIERAQNVASGFENGLRIEFRKILNKPSLHRGFSKAEMQAVEDVVKGSTAANLTKLAGKFGFGGGNASNMLGGTIGFGAGSLTPFGPLGGIAVAAAGTGARKVSEKLTERAANRALGAVGTKGLKVLPAVDPSKIRLPERLIRGLSVPAGGQLAANR